jgi:hexaprenyl-diphosphate synthase
LDFTSSEETLGKPASVDLSLGLATAPVLFAREEFPILSEMIERKFEREGDVMKVSLILLFFFNQ